MEPESAKGQTAANERVPTDMPRAALPQHQPAGAPSGRSQTGWIVGGMAAVVGMLAIGAFATGLISFPGSGPGAKAPVEIQQTQQSGGMITAFGTNEIDRAVGMLAMSEQDRAQVRTQVMEGKLRIGWIMVSDDRQEDGDWVAISAGGFKQDIRLFKAPLMVAIPYTPGGSVTVTGLVDGGGGGVTAAVHVGGNPVLLKPLVVGESLTIPTP